MIKRSIGIDAWKDISFERGTDGRVHFKGTAYFKDLTKVRIYPDDRTRINFGPDGTTALLLILNRAKPAAEPPKPSKPMTPEDLSKHIKELRDRYQQTKSTVTTELPGMKLDMVFHAPGTLEAMDAQMSDGTVLRQWAAAGKSSNVKELMNERLFGLKGEIWARWKGPFKQRFDYAAEMDAAKKAQQQMMLKLGLDKPRTTSSTSAPARETPPKKETAPTPAKKAPDAPAGKGPPSAPMPDPTKIPAPILPF
jgi:hypothetical protein